MKNNKTYYEDVVAGKIDPKDPFNYYLKANTDALELAKKAKVINWPQRLQSLAERKARFNKLSQAENNQYHKELDEARTLAKSWVTCACGNQCSIIPRDGGGEPRDEKLSSYGISFFESINVAHFGKASKTLERIEKRSGLLIAKILEKEKKNKNA